MRPLAGSPGRSVIRFHSASRSDSATSCRATFGSRSGLGARVERALDGDGVNVGPSAYFRWDFARKFRLRDRGIGIQIEYRPVPNWQLFLAGFRSSDRFRLDQRPGAPAGMTFRDRQVSVGGGGMVRISHTLRLGAEIGAIVDRRVSVSARDDGRLDSADGDVSPYLSLRAEVRL